MPEQARSVPQLGAPVSTIPQGIEADPLLETACEQSQIRGGTQHWKSLVAAVAGALGLAGLASIVFSGQVSRSVQSSAGVQYLRSERGFISLQGYSAADAINARFANCNPAGGVMAAGVLIHQWDNMEGTGSDQLWMPCQQDWCQNYADRFSTSLINAQMPLTDGKIGLFSDTLGGFVIAPGQANVLCSYPSDGGSMSKTCDGGACLPGCDPKACTPDVWWTCSFPADQLGAMFDAYKANPAKYNEVVIGTANWDPASIIEAFFYPAPAGGCGSCGEGCAQTRDQHSAYLQTFGMASTQVPLLCLDQSTFGVPFIDMSGQV